MGGPTRLNILLTHQQGPARHSGSQQWYQTLAHLLAPMGVRTFEATSGPQAVDLIEHHPIHLAVVDSRLPAISGINVLQLIQKLGQQGERNAPADPKGVQPESQNLVQFHIRVEEKKEENQRRIEVRFDARPAPDTRIAPAVILLAPPQQDQQLLQEALKFNAFTVLSEPVDVNLMLEVMARALRRFHQNQWPV